MVLKLRIEKHLTSKFAMSFWLDIKAILGILYR